MWDVCSLRCDHIILQLHSHTEKHTPTSSWQHSLSSSVHFSLSPLSLVSPLTFVFRPCFSSPFSNPSCWAICLLLFNLISLATPRWQRIPKRMSHFGCYPSRNKTFCSFSLWNWKYINLNRPFPKGYGAQEYHPCLMNTTDVYLDVKYFFLSVKI